MNRVNALLNAFSIKYNSDVVKKNANNPKLLFRIINRLQHRIEETPMPPPTSESDLENEKKVWNERCANEKEINILENMNKSVNCVMCVTSILNNEESYTIIEFLCTYKNLQMCFLISNVQCKMQIKNYYYYLFQPICYENVLMKYYHY